MSILVFLPSSRYVIISDTDESFFVHDDDGKQARIIPSSEGSTPFRIRTSSLICLSPSEMISYISRIGLSHEKMLSNLSSLPVIRISSYGEDDGEKFVTDDKGHRTLVNQAHMTLLKIVGE